MYGYFSNNKYEPDFSKAKCQQNVLAVKKAIMKFEQSPLKSKESAGAVIRKTIYAKTEDLSKRAKEIKSSFNSWTFLAIFSAIHIGRMRFLKKNLNEMELPIYNIYCCFLGSFLLNLPVSQFFSNNYGNKIDIIKANKELYNLERSFSKNYFMPLFAEEVKRLEIEGEIEKKI